MGDGKVIMPNRFKDSAELLVNEIGKYPNIYEQHLNLNTDVSCLSEQGAQDWAKVMEIMQAKYGTELDDDMAWRSWRTVRYKYIHYLRNKKAPSSSWKWIGKIPFLENLTDSQLSGEQSSRDAEQAKPEGANNAERPLSLEFGEQIIIDLAAEISKHPVFHDYDYMKDHPTTDDLPEEAQAIWDSIIRNLQKTYNGACSRKAWRAYRNLRSSYNTRCPAKYKDALAFLNQSKKRQATSAINNESNSADGEPKRKTRSSGASVRINYNENSVGEDYVDIMGDFSPVGSVAPPSPPRLFGPNNMPPLISPSRQRVAQRRQPDIVDIQSLSARHSALQEHPRRPAQAITGGPLRRPIASSTPRIIQRPGQSVARPNPTSVQPAQPASDPDDAFRRNLEHAFMKLATSHNAEENIAKFKANIIRTLNNAYDEI